jgi:replicative DNA helicase
MNILKHNIKGDTIIPFFSLENNEYQTFERMIQLELNVSSFEIENNFKNNNQSFISECQEVSEKWSNVINIVKRVSLEDIIPYIKVCEKLTDKKVKFVLIDYAQLIKCTGKEYEKVSEIAQQLKEISLNLRIPLIVLSQVSRQEARNENGLTLYSAKGSGEIENSAQILFSLERLKEINQEVLDGKTLARNDKGDCAILKLKTLKKKRGKDLKEILIILNYPSLRMMEYSQQVQSEVQFDKQPF